LEEQPGEDVAHDARAVELNELLSMSNHLYSMSLLAAHAELTLYLQCTQRDRSRCW